MSELPEERRLLKFKDLKARRIAENYPRLKELIDNWGFPKGFWTGPNSHCWWEDAVLAWLETRPTERPPARSKRDGTSSGRKSR
jgi:predicted DNA-binding transcriptional regulator AlpA